MSSLTPQTIVARKPVHASRVQDDLVFFDDQAGRYFATGSVGAEIWEILDTPCSVQDICNRLIERYEVEPETCLTDVSAFLEDLSAAGLIEAS